MDEITSFKQAKYTAIISDLHLCEAEPVNKKYPLWKKYKTSEFFFDEDFKDFLQEIVNKASGEKIELILNGDIFDFDSVMKLPDKPIFRVSWLERQRGLFPRPERSQYKMKTILEDHPIFVEALRDFLLSGHRVVLILGNHDLELHFPEVQNELIDHLQLPVSAYKNLRFVEWFYISNGDTLIEHGNQYDPYCLCEDPIHPFSKGYNFIFLKLPFGNLACRYILNGLGFFNPHVDSNYIMSLRDYLNIFFRYMVKAQPFLVLTWFSGAVITLLKTIEEHFARPLKNPLKVEDRVQKIAERANADPRMLREMKELLPPPASAQPLLLMRELWLDRAFLLMITFYFCYYVVSMLKSWFDISLFWLFIPLFLLLPFFLFYSKSVKSLVSSYKEPDEKILRTTSAITKVQRIIYGHTHHVRHEIIGSVEHLNPGCWSPAFLDIECTKPVDEKNYVWIFPAEEGSDTNTSPRLADLIPFKGKKNAVRKKY